MWLFLDIGSTFIKRLLIDENRCVDQKTVSTPENIASVPGRYEIDAEALYCLVMRVIEEAANPKIKGILFSTQMHGCLVTDEEGHPETPFITWQDRASLDCIKGETTLRFMEKALPEGALFAAGVPLKANLGIASLAARARAGMRFPRRALFHTLGGYLIYRLCGAHVCHMTNAAPCGIADVRAGTLNNHMIRAAGLERLIFPKLLTRYAPCGRATIAGVAMSVFPDIGDQQVCLTGTDCRPDTDLHVNIGTAGLIGMLTREYLPGPYENRVWTEPGFYLRTVSGLPGGRVMNALHDALISDGLTPDEAWRFLTHARGEPVPLQWAEKSLLPAKPADMNNDLFCVSVLDAVARRYQSAAAAMRCPARALWFTGGCVIKNELLRKRFLARFDPEAAYLYDIEKGALALSHMADTAFEREKCK